MLNILYIILACILSAILYRCGGMSKEYTAKPKWIPFWLRNSKTRDIGCSLVLIALVIALFGAKIGYIWGYMLTFGLSWGALSAYWGLDNKKYGFWAHGLCCGLAGIPLIWCGVPTWLILTRLLICTIGMSIWSEFIDDDIQEELGRGILFIL